MAMAPHRRSYHPMDTSALASPSWRAVGVTRVCWLVAYQHVLFRCHMIPYDRCRYTVTLHVYFDTYGTWLFFAHASFLPAYLCWLESPFPQGTFSAISRRSIAQHHKAVRYQGGRVFRSDIQHPTCGLGIHMYHYVSIFFINQMGSYRELLGALSLLIAY